MQAQLQRPRCHRPPPFGAAASASAVSAAAASARRPRRPLQQPPMAAQPLREESVSFANGRGERLAATLATPPGSAAAAPAVILCHGFSSHRDGFHYRALAGRLAAAGLASLRFDFAGNGESQGVFQFGNYASEVADIAAAQAFLEAGGRSVVALVGHSKGAGSVLLHASSLGAIPVVINVAGRFDMSAGLTARFGPDIFERLAAGPVAQTTRTQRGAFAWTLTPESMAERLALDMAAVCATIRARPGMRLLTVHGDADDVIPIDDGRRIAELAGGELAVVAGADHMFRGPAATGALLDRVSAFIIAAAADADAVN